jgi:branched-chain amino acid transport system ATP-binding protein
VADRAVVLEVGRVALEGSAAELAESEHVRDRYLGVAPEPAAAGAADDEPAPASRVGELTVEQVTVRFGGITALNEGEPFWAGHERRVS